MNVYVRYGTPKPSKRAAIQKMNKTTQISNNEWIINESKTAFNNTFQISHLFSVISVYFIIEHC